MKLDDKPTQFLNVQVVSIPEKDPVTHKLKYKTTFMPEKLIVTAYDTVINYQLVHPTPAGVKFKSVSIKPGREDQLSDPSISESGKMVTFSDANTRKADFNLTLHFKDDIGVEFAVDPELSNEPQPNEPLKMMLIPELGNEPQPN